MFNQIRHQMIIIRAMAMVTTMKYGNQNNTQQQSSSRASKSGYGEGGFNNGSFNGGAGQQTVAA